MHNLYTAYVTRNNCPALPFNAGSLSSPSSCCCCSCNCCSSAPINTVTTSRLVRIDPTPFYGFSQSILIQRPRRMILAIGDLCPPRTAYRDLSCSMPKGLEFGGYGRDGSVCDDAEAIVSLIGEELSSERRKKKVSLPKKGVFRDSAVDEEFRDFLKAKESRMDMGSEKEYRKRVGSVAIREQVKEILEDRRIERNHCLERVRRDDLRRKSWKKLREESVSDANASDSSYKYEDRRGNSGFVNEKRTGYKASGSKKQSEICTACGQVSSGNEQKTKRIQSKNGIFMSNAETKVASRREECSSMIQESGNAVHEQHKQESANAMISTGRSNRSDTQYTGMRFNSAVRQESKSRIKRQEEARNLEEVNQKRHQEHHEGSSRTELTGNNQKCVEIVDNSDINVQDTSRAQQKREKEVSVSSRLAKEQRFSTDMQDKRQEQSRKSSKDLSGSLQVHCDETKIVVPSSAFEERLHYDQSYLRENYVKESIKPTELGYEIEKPLRGSNVTSASQIRIEEVAEEEDKRIFSSGMPPRLNPPRSVEVANKQDEIADQAELRYEARMSLREPSLVKETSRHPHVTSISQFGELCEEEDERNLPYGPSQNLYSHSQSIEPKHLHENVMKTVKQSKVRHEVHMPLTEPSSVKETSGPSFETSTSQIKIEEISDEEDDRLVCSGELGSSQRLASSHQSAEPHPVFFEAASTFPSEDSLGSSAGESNISSMGSFTANEPHDETLPLDQQMENSEASQVGIVSRSGRVLWNVLANVVQLRWGLLSEPHNISTVRTSGNMETGTSMNPLLPSSSHQPVLGRTPTQSSNIELNVDKINWSQRDVKQLRGSHRRSDAIYEIHTSGNEATGSGTVDQSKGESDPSLNFVSSSEENEAEIRQGKLSRSNQFMKEKFDEWQEAFRLESEQRKIDQGFMREAIEEAKKASDIWEVPVGAVLVQDGKVIARGHNLVEKLRDSTAHAEIMCIRDASNILKTWRLSETTLYVTLEPCAMCAGAILQARINTLVYGAPNKLLGADGSWVRLFPGSVDGEGGSETTSKAEEGPVHPFHLKMKIRRGILEAECGELMQQSFKLRRKKGNKGEEQSSSKELHHPSKLLHKMHRRFNFLVCL